MRHYEGIDEYVAAHTSAEPAHLQRVYRYTNLHHLYPRMCTGHVQGRLLSMLTSMIAPRYVLEIGTFTGYATLCMAEHVAPGGELHTIEVNDEMEEELTERFASRPEGGCVRLHIGDALEVIPALANMEWDMVLIDANKRNYIEYYEAVLPQMRRGGYILADNTLWDGKVTDADAHVDPQMRGILEFNELVAHDERVTAVMVPVRDGLTIIRKL